MAAVKVEIGKRPGGFARKVHRRDAAAAKDRVNHFPVRHRCRGGVGIPVFLAGRGLFEDFRVPFQRPGGGVKTQHPAGGAFVLRGGQEEVVPPDDGGRPAFARDAGLPFQILVFLRVPLQRQLCPGRHALPGGPPEPRPVFLGGHRGYRGKQQAGEGRGNNGGGGEFGRNHGVAGDFFTYALK